MHHTALGPQRIRKPREPSPTRSRADARGSAAGFPLLELLITLVVIAILAAIAHSDPNPSNWNVTELASLGSYSSSSDCRSFLYAADVVYETGYDAVLSGSGDREHPFDTAITERLYMAKDYATGALAIDSSGNPFCPTITQSSLYDVTSERIANPAACPSGMTATIAS